MRSYGSMKKGQFWIHLHSITQHESIKMYFAVKSFYLGSLPVPGGWVKQSAARSNKLQSKVSRGWDPDTWVAAVRNRLQLADEIGSLQADESSSGELPAYAIYRSRLMGSIRAWRHINFSI